MRVEQVLESLGELRGAFSFRQICGSVDEVEQLSRSLGAVVVGVGAEPRQLADVVEHVRVGVRGRVDAEQSGGEVVSLGIGQSVEEGGCLVSSAAGKRCSLMLCRRRPMSATTLVCGRVMTSWMQFSMHATSSPKIIAALHPARIGVVQRLPRHKAPPHRPRSRAGSRSVQMVSGRRAFRSLPPTTSRLPARPPPSTAAAFR